MIELARQTGQPLPDKIKNRPHLVEGLAFYWRAFWELGTDRDFSTAEGPIKWSAMNAYCIRHGLWGDEYDIFVLIMKGVDTAYLAKRAAEHKRAMKPKGGKGSFKKIGKK